MSKLAYISDQNLDAALKKLYDRAQAGLKRAKDDFDRNVIDPFSLIFEMDQFGIATPNDWVRFEERRQAQKNLVQAVGNFHQDILGSVEGWINTGHGGGVDLISEENRILAEVKNKHNTIKGSDRTGLYDSLADEVLPKNSKYHGYTAYYVEIIPKGEKRFDKPFTPSTRQTGLQKPANDKIRTIDGASFYKLVTGRDHALKELFEVLMTDLSNKYNLDKAKKDVIYSYFNKAF
ncbi:Eco47II family restriction endonuclease [Pseudochrobactrum sp. HB0163]|uniref:Eco47II family restriction endonuclease n=1 Tax=Pseudochrobactrum sp. HB0163 TaxID=3450708 RepID=UPI003F6E0072